MSGSAWIGGTVITAFVVFTGRQVYSQVKTESAKSGEEKKSAADDNGQRAAVNREEMMKKWKRASTPGEHHKHLQYFVGKWDTVMRMWMGGPGGPPTESKGQSEIKWVLDGHYLLEESTIDVKMPDATGKMSTTTQKGMGLFGYDNFKNLYVGSWFSNVSTELITMRGTRDPTGKGFTYYGQMDEPMLDIYGREVKYVSRIVDDKNYVFEIYDLHGGESYKVVEIAYARK